MLIDKCMGRYSTSFHFFFVGLVFLFSSCSPVLFDGTPLVVTPSDLTLYVGQTAQLSVNKDHGVSYRVLEPFYASVDADGMVTAKKAGFTSVVVSNGTRTVYVSINVKSTYSLYPDMDYHVGRPFSEIKDYLGSYDDVTRTTDYVTYWYNFRGKYLVSFGFIFKKGDDFGTIQAVSVYVPVDYDNQLSTYLWDRYFCYEALNDCYYFYNHDRSVYMKLEYYPSQRLYNIMYVPSE